MEEDWLDRLITYFQAYKSAAGGWYIKLGPRSYHAFKCPCGKHLFHITRVR